MLSNPTRVWFQDSSKYLLHYDWASRRLAPFKGMSRDQFDAATLFRTNQLAVLGAVLFPRNPATHEYGIQFVGFDAYPPELVVSIFRLVQAAILTDRPQDAYYMPAFEQKAATQSHADYFQSQNIKVSGIERWYADQSNVCYVGGWVVGRLVFVTAANLTDAYRITKKNPAALSLRLATRAPGLTASPGNCTTSGKCCSNTSPNFFLALS